MKVKAHLEVEVVAGGEGGEGVAHQQYQAVEVALEVGRSQPGPVPGRVEMIAWWSARRRCCL